MFHGLPHDCQNGGTRARQDVGEIRSANTASDEIYFSWEEAGRYLCEVAMIR